MWDFHISTGGNKTLSATLVVGVQFESFSVLINFCLDTIKKHIEIEWILRNMPGFVV